MQTFLPYPDFYLSARVLDNKRLGKQRVECLQILRALSDSSYGWQNHPAVRMWRGYDQALVDYSMAIIYEWRSIRGFKDTCGKKIYDEFMEGDEPENPPWFADHRIFASHRSNLLRKDPVWYGQFGWTEPPDMEYIWPV